MLDRYLRDFIEDLWEDGESKGFASDALRGIGHFIFIPACKQHMIAAWRLHAAWGRPKFPCRAPPFTPLLLHALAQAAFDNGVARYSSLLMVGFHTFPRSGELFQAGCKEFVLSATSGTWTLPLPKSGQRSGNIESILLDDPYICVALPNDLCGIAPGDLLSGCSPQTQ